MLIQNKIKLTSFTFISFFVTPFLFSLSGSVAFASVNAGSDDADIVTAVCGDPGDEGAGEFFNCVTSVEQDLSNCEQTDSIPGVSRPEQIANCRQSVIDARRDGEPSEGSSVFEGDCSEENRLNPDEGPLHPDNCGITQIIRFAADILAVLVGVVIVMMIVIGGIQYSSAGSNPQAVSAAKKKISQALLALLIYFFLFAFLQWLVPGGVF